MSRQPHRDIIMFSTADWYSRYWTNKQHVASRFAARGDRVLYVETVGLRLPGLNATDAKRIAARLKRGLSPIRAVGDNLWRLSPLTIPFGHRSPVIAGFNQFQLTMRIKSWLSANCILSPLVWAYHPYMLEAARSIKPAKLIYHCADYLGAVPGIDQASFDAEERELLARADVTFAASHRLQERCSAIAGARSHYFGNVADVSHFATARSAPALPPELEIIPRPRLGYVGALSDFKIDFDLLCAMVDRRPDWQLVLIGDEREGQADRRLADLVRHPNVHLLGWRPYQDLPHYMAGMDVALLPLLINDYTQAMFPMKFFEYVAAGLPIVSTPLDGIREYTSLYSVASDAAAFTNAVRSILASRPSQLALDNPILLQNSWDERLDRMLDVIEAGELR
jgi:glycosyltransferase involved in cell wall biosynthesis